MGPIQRRALIGLLSFSLDAGSPFLSLHGGVDLLDVLRLGARVDLIEDSALRVAAETTWTWLELDRAGFDLEVYAGRAFGLEAVSTWDAGLLLQGRLTLDDRMTAALRGGVYGYQGRERVQTGLVGITALRLYYALSDEFFLGGELGWMFGPGSDRPAGGLIVAYRPFTTLTRTPP